jgi:hypothetical protein
MLSVAAFALPAGAALAMRAAAKSATTEIDEGLPSSARSSSLHDGRRTRAQLL